MENDARITNPSIQDIRITNPNGRGEWTGYKSEWTGRTDYKSAQTEN